MPILKDLTGKRFGRLQVVRRKGTTGSKWICLCDCGQKKSVSGNNLQRNTKSCGCLAREVSSRMGKKHVHFAQEATVTHGLSGTPEYEAWNRAKQRCRLNRHYIKRNIVMCKRWKSDTTTFIEDMGSCPAGYTLDRIDNDGNYSCGKCKQCRRNGWKMNCRWATWKQQSRNRSSNVFLTMNGKTLTIQDWAARLDMNISTFRRHYVSN